jgi:hypothetical protein
MESGLFPAGMADFGRITYGPYKEMGRFLSDGNGTFGEIQRPCPVRHDMLVVDDQ